MEFEIRRGTTSEKEKILNVISYAYSIPEPSHERILERLELTADEFFIHFLDGDATAVGRLIPFEQNIRGVMKKMGGVGMVASIPEYRRLGYVRDLMIHTLREIRTEGYAVSTLHPFKDTFYSAMGYVKMPLMYIIEFDPKHLRDVKHPDGYTVSRESGDDAKEIWRTLQEQIVRETHGTVIRPDNRWNELTSNMRSKIVIARNSDGVAEGVLIHSIKGYGEGHSWAEKGEISVFETFWSSLKARDALLHHIYKHEDQVVKVVLKLGTTMTDFYNWLSEFHTPDIKPQILNMARIVDVEASFSNLEIDSEGEVSIRIKDNILPENDGVYSFKVHNRKLSVKRVEKEPGITLTIEGATSLLYGTLDEKQLRHLGWLKGEDASILFKWFTREIPWLSEEF